jgi:hypothetical protein
VAINFQPTYLYIKQHSVTGKLYFGKTIRNPEKYLGSGIRWQSHIKKHGKEQIDTLWYCLYYDRDECTKFALDFSEQQNIVESKEWLNLKAENGLNAGGECSSEVRLKMSESHKGKSQSAEHIAKRQASRKGYAASAETKAKIRNIRTGTTRSAETKAKISFANKGRPGTFTGHTHSTESIAKRTATRKHNKITQKKSICPHCGITGGSGGMNRWHFNNCKFLTKEIAL